MNFQIELELLELLKEVRKTLKRFYELMTSVKALVETVTEWYPYSCGKSYLAQLRAEGKNEQYLRQYVDDIKLTLPPLPGAPDDE